MNETYALPALVPAAPWLGNRAPAAPQARVNNGVVTITGNPDASVSLWVVQARWPTGWRTDIIPITQRQWKLAPPNGTTGGASEIWVSTVDRVGNQSKVVRAHMMP